MGIGDLERLCLTPAPSPSPMIRLWALERGALVPQSGFEATQC